jgi:hypothetical protein
MGKKVDGKHQQNQAQDSKPEPKWDVQSTPLLEINY